MNEWTEFRLDFFPAGFLRTSLHRLPANCFRPLFRKALVMEVAKTTTTISSLSNPSGDPGAASQRGRRGGRLIYFLFKHTRGKFSACGHWCSPDGWETQREDLCFCWTISTRDTRECFFDTDDGSGLCVDLMNGTSKKLFKFETYSIWN